MQNVLPSEAVMLTAGGLANADRQGTHSFSPFSVGECLLTDLGLLQ